MSDIPFKHFVEVRTAFAPALSPDGSGLAYVSNLTGYPEAYLHVGDREGPVQLTEYRERVSVVRWRPDGRWLVLDTDHGGDERWAVRSVRPDGSGHRTLTDAPDVMHIMGQISPCGKLLSCSRNSRDPALFDLGVVDLDSGASRVLLADDASNMPFGFSPDGKWVIAARVFGSFRQELVLVPVAGGPPRSITAGGEDIRNLQPVFEAGGDTLLLLSDRGRDFLGLARLHLETLDLEWLYAPEDRDVERLALARGGTAILSENIRGYSRLLVRRAGAGAPVPLEHPEGVVNEVAISSDGTTAAFSLARASSPMEVYLADPASGATRRATHSPREGIEESDLIEPEEVRFSSFDGTEIPGWLYLPKSSSRSPCPAVVKVHGGPESQARPVYDPLVQYLVHRGFAVFEPNVRGSTGYGRAYAAMDDKRLRFDAVRDLEHAARFLRESGRVDGARISLLGGSYGGFMVLAGLAFYPDLWRAGVDIVGIANFKTFLEHTGPYRRKWRAAEYGDPVEDGDFLDEISPVHHADRIRAPLLVIQGANDPRVPQDEGEQIVRAVREQGGIAEYMLFTDEGHGIVKLPNRIRAYEAIVTFLQQHS